jgi:plasmid stabilization system protein ParE
MKPLSIHPAARDEVEHAASHYESERTGLGREFRIEFEAAVARIVENPQLFAIELGEFRACLLKRFSYTIAFIDLPQRIWIGAVAHQSRRPNYWARRKPN